MVIIINYIPTWILMVMDDKNPAINLKNDSGFPQPITFRGQKVTYRFISP